MNALANVLVQLERFPEAIRLCQEALVADRKRGPEDAGVLAHTLASLSEAYFYSGNLAAAEAPMREALKVREQAFGLHHALTAVSLNNLGVLLYQSGRYDEAQSTYQQALPIYREIYGSEHPEVATLINNIGRSALVSGRVDEAEPLLRQSLVMFQKFYRDDYDGLISPLNSLAMIDAYRGRLDAARSEIRRADAIARLPDHGELLDQVLLNEADIELANGNRERAAVLLAESKTLLQKAHPNGPGDAWRYAVWDLMNAQLLAANGDFAVATSTLAAAQKILVQRFGENGFYSLLAKRRTLSIAHAQRV
jgi:tetratricopeptide (TPR) repeat protein